MIASRYIERKRAGDALSAGEIERFFSGYLDGTVTDYQMSAFLMAVHFQGLSTEELDALLSTMIASGTTLELGHLPGPRVDKHSTGGVGDKVSIVLAPLAAELGLYVPMMSGRGLGHTGGTLDKLEAIPGFRTDLPTGRFVEVLEREGFAMTGQTPEIAPLDKRLYDLRSVTGTVAAIPLIAASIMSKKLAEGLTGLVLDVKTGPGAFIPELPRSLELAETMVRLGSGAGVQTIALLTAMDRPLGRAIGNGLETREALDCLAGGGPADLRELSLALVVEMAVVGGVASARAGALSAATDALDSGKALERFTRVVELQGGDPRSLAPGGLAEAPVVRTVTAAEGGTVHAIDPLALGRCVTGLGGGRKRLGDAIDPAVGFVVAVGLGDDVEVGQQLGVVHARDTTDASMGESAMRSAVTIGAGPAPEALPLVSHRVDATGAEVL